MIQHSNHGSIKSKSTQTLVLELHKKLVDNFENYEEHPKQSKAYDFVGHKILVEKMIIQNFSQRALKAMSNYLENRHHYVEIDGF